MEDYLSDAEAGKIIPGRFCGLNASWSVSAWQLTDGPLNCVNGAYFITDNEDGSASLVRRFYDDDAGLDEVIDLVTLDWDEAGVSALVAEYIIRTNKVGA